jgi:hypothetical protein
MVAYFEEYWKSNSGNDESFWAHVSALGRALLTTGVE